MSTNYWIKDAMKHAEYREVRARFLAYAMDESDDGPNRYMKERALIEELFNVGCLVAGYDDVG